MGELSSSVRARFFRYLGLESVFFLLTTRWRGFLRFFFLLVNRFCNKRDPRGKICMYAIKKSEIGNPIKVVGFYLTKVSNQLLRRVSLFTRRNNLQLPLWRRNFFGKKDFSN